MIAGTSISQRSLWVVLAAGALLALVVAVSQTAHAETITWETAADWDASSPASERHVHENVGFTDHQDDATLQRGYPHESGAQDSSLVAEYPMDEDTDTGTVHDTAGTADLTQQSAGYTFEQTGIMGTSSISYGGGGHITNSLPDVGNTFTACAWINADTVPQNDNFAVIFVNGAEGPGGQMKFLLQQDGSNANIRAIVGNGITNNVVTDPNTYNAGVWYHYCVSYDGTNVNLWRNGTSVASNNLGVSTFTSSDFVVGEGNGGGNLWDGRIEEVQIYDESASTVVPNDVWGAADGDIQDILQRKSLNTAGRPDLVNLSYSLNSAYINLTVTGSPGVGGQESHTVVLDGATSYNIPWTQDHTEFEVALVTGLPDREITPTVGSISLEAETGGGGGQPDPGTPVGTTDETTVGVWLRPHEFLSHPFTVYAQAQNATGWPIQVNETPTLTITYVSIDQQVQWVNNSTGATETTVTSTQMDPVPNNNGTLWRVNVSGLTVSADHRFTARFTVEQINGTGQPQNFTFSGSTNQAPDGSVSAFSHNTELAQYTKLTALELTFFLALAITGIILWSRSTDGAVRSFGASLPVLSGVLLLMFGTDQGLGSMWSGTVAFSALLMLIGVYLFIRYWMDVVREDDAGGGFL